MSRSPSPPHPRYRGIPVKCFPGDYCGITAVIPAMLLSSVRVFVAEHPRLSRQHHHVAERRQAGFDDGLVTVTDRHSAAEILKSPDQTDTIRHEMLF